LERADEVWSYAREHGFAILSKDSDFHQRSLLYGHPPKVVWVRKGNRDPNEGAASHRR
jgi:predicted nuclease of predicted toxin-antitoxin system